MSMPWYKIAEGSTITQGDIVVNCPVASWSESPLTVSLDVPPEEILRTSVEFIQVDTVVMTQACDLEQGKVRYVILCPHYAIEDYKIQWEYALRERMQNPTEKSWQTFVEDVHQGKRFRLQPPYREHLSQAFARFFMRVGLPIDIPRFR